MTWPNDPRGRLLEVSTNFSNRARQRKYHHPIVGLNFGIANGNKRLVTPYDTADYGSPWEVYVFDLAVCGGAIGFGDKFEHFGLATIQTSDRLHVGAHGEPKDRTCRYHLLIYNSVDPDAFGQIDVV